MMFHINKMIVFLCVAVALCASTRDAFAVKKGHSTWINPLWKDLVFQPPPLPEDRPGKARNMPVCVSYEEFMNVLKDMLETRTTHISIRLVYDYKFNELQSIIDQAFEDILLEDGYTGGSVYGRSAKWSGDDGDATFDANISYTATFSQEQDVSRRVEEIIGNIIDISMNDEDKVKAIHDWVVLNVEYDQTYQRRSAYHALFGVKETVCQGYALLVIRMLQEVNIESKFVVGFVGNVNHAWNLINLCNHWFHLDATWNDPIIFPPDPDHISWNYYLLSDAQILKDHSFETSDYPEAPNNYVKGLCAPQKGDLNVDHKVDIGDAILALQTCTGKTVQIDLDAEVGGNNRIGLEEVIYILKMIGSSLDS